MLAQDIRRVELSRKVSQHDVSRYNGLWT
jgi:hypothetical protein